MITAIEARKNSNSAQKAILDSPRFKYIFEKLDERIKTASTQGDRCVSWTDHTDSKMHIAWNGDDAFKNKLHELGYRFSQTDHGHYELSW